MTQTFAEKADAIRSLLPLIYFHLDDIPGAIKVQRYGVSDGGGGESIPYNINCNGRCYTCLAYHAMVGRRPACPPNEKWMREWERLRNMYRLEELEECVLGLATDLARAVWAVYVEPWPDPKTEPIGKEARAHRKCCAENGIAELARMMKGDVLGEGDRPQPRDNEIRRLSADGLSQRRIARQLKCSLREVSRVLSPVLDEAT